MLIRASLLVALGLWLASSAGVASAMLVTWTISGTASTGSESLPYFPNDSPYVLTITFDTATPPTSVSIGQTRYDGAIVAATFESATYSPVIDLELSQIAISFFGTLFGMGAAELSAEHPGISLSVPNQGHGFPIGRPFPLPTVPPDGDYLLAIYGSDAPDLYLQSNIAGSSIDHSVPEPGLGWLAALAALAVGSTRTSRRKRR